MKRGRFREAIVLLASLGVVLAGVIVHEVRSTRATPPSSANSALRLSDLPSGAPSLPSSAPSAEALRGCDIADRGNGDYLEKGPMPMGHLYVRPLAVGADGDYELLLHFHGGEAARKLLLPEQLRLVIAVVDRGVGSSAYQGTFASRRSWDELIGNIDRLVSDASGHPAHTRHIVVSSWSAGYKAVEEVLNVAQNDPAIEGIVLLDSLHASYPEGKSQLEHGQLAQFVGAARHAAHDPSFFFNVTHSEIKPPGYASTTETSSLLLSELGITAETVREGGRDVLPLTRVAEEGRFTVRGYAGNDARAHCDQLRLLPSILEAHGLR